MSSRPWLIGAALLLMAGGVATWLMNRTQPLRPTPISARDADGMVQAAIDHARSNLAIVNPVLVQVMFSCIDSQGHLDPTNTACPGTMILTVQDRSHRNSFVLAAVAAEGLVATRAPRDQVMALPPAKCSAGRLLSQARARGLSWKPETTLFVHYGPAQQGGAHWSIERDRVPLLELTDAECAASLPDAG